MSLGTHPIEIGDAFGFTGFWRSLLCFQEAGLRTTDLCTAAENPWTSKRHAPNTSATAEAASGLWGVLVSNPASPFRAADPFRGAATGVRGD